MEIKSGEKWLISSQSHVSVGCNCCFRYLKWEELQSEISEHVEQCLLLPLLESWENNETVSPGTPYYIITESWLEFDENFFPRLPVAGFDVQYSEFVI
jgi:hypothetical protein